MTTLKQRRLAVAGLAVSLSLAVSGCAGFGDLGNEPGVTTVTLASVNNPQMQDMAQLLPEFNKLHPDIKINMIFMEENDLRNAATKDVATQGGQYDIMTVGAYEVPIWGQNRWLENLTDLAAADPDYDVDDFFKPVRDGVSYDGRLYAVPFYGESSFLMYRKDLFKKAGITMPERPTWDQIAEYADKLKDPSTDRAGICLRAKPGWGEMFAPLTTVINTFGGQWYNMDWQAQVNAPGFTEAVKFYIDTLADAGESDPVSFGFTECLNLFSQERAAMWYDATSAAGSVEDAKNSKVAGKVGYVRAPVKLTENSGWLWSWNLGINAESKNKGPAWEFVKWATSKQYAKLVGSELGWSRTPPGTRKSTYLIPQYIQAGGEFAPLTAKIMNEVDPTHPGVDPQPWVGIQYVTIPEFQDVGNQTSQLLADVIAGRRPLDLALDQGQKIAQRAGDNQKKG
ncbi:MAG: sugar ABC transporter substrate-binding protein [Microlunatus sp.]|nr:sugar ABC transporter substrate-binding protein [Microlunatus sp.]MDN5770329.1 sugar ABC transporter substrate-binding protein [Microlunatus sp.]